MNVIKKLLEINDLYAQVKSIKSELNSDDKINLEGCYIIMEHFRVSANLPNKETECLMGSIYNGKFVVKSLTMKNDNTYEVIKTHNFLSSSKHSNYEGITGRIYFIAKRYIRNVDCFFKVEKKWHMLNSDLTVYFKRLDVQLEDAGIILDVNSQEFDDLDALVRAYES